MYAMTLGLEVTLQFTCGQSGAADSRLVARGLQQRTWISGFNEDVIYSLVSHALTCQLPLQVTRNSPSSYGAESLRNQYSLTLSLNNPPFKEREGSLPCSKQPISPAESSPYSDTILVLRCSFMRLSHLYLGLPVGFFFIFSGRNFVPSFRSPCACHVSAHFLCRYSSNKWDDPYFAQAVADKRIWCGCVMQQNPVASPCALGVIIRFASEAGNP